jgi:hypothetical protein
MIIQGATIRDARVVDGTAITQNLLVYLDANNAASYSGTGTTVNDLSGNGYTHTLSSSGIYTVLNGVKCFDCTTTGQVVVNGTGPALPTSGFTYIGWARLLNSTANWRTLWRTVASDHPLLIEAGTNNLGMFDNNGADFESAGYSVSGLADTWVQWAVTGTNTTQTFYINGQQVGTTAYGAGGNLHSNWGNWNNGQPFGYVANMFLYSTILTAEQIQQNYYGSRRNFGILSYTTTGSTTWTAPLGVTSVNYLVVAGGGGGGQAADNAGAGGGGAGMVLTGNITVAPGTSYTVTVGDGGAGGNSGSNVGAQGGTVGSNSVFATITALGGGGGYASRSNTTLVGAAQVGNTTAATGGGGGPGGGGGAGGGGATGAGTDNSGATGGAGGAGINSSITGSAVTYGTGALGGNAGSQNSGNAGASNTGNGGQGGGATSANYRAGGKGGSGIVVLRYNQE